MNSSKLLPEPFDPDKSIEFGKLGRSLSQEIRERTGENINLCYQCRTCANGCPFLEAMDYSCNAVLRMLQFGMRREVLGCSTIWLCVGCHTCSSQCPNSIDIAAVMDALRQMAQEEGAPVPQPDILYLHQAVLRSLKRYGRAHKVYIMWRHKLKTRRWLTDIDLGLKMLVKHKLELKPCRMTALEEIEPFFAPPKKAEAHDQ